MSAQLAQLERVQMVNLNLLPAVQMLTEYAQLAQLELVQMVNLNLLLAVQMLTEYAQFALLVVLLVNTNLLLVVQMLIEYAQLAHQLSHVWRVLGNLLNAVQMLIEYAQPVSETAKNVLVQINVKSAYLVSSKPMVALLAQLVMLVHALMELITTMLSVLAMDFHLDACNVQTDVLVVIW
jgi:hypothetical protein